MEKKNRTKQRPKKRPSVQLVKTLRKKNIYVIMADQE